MQPNNFNYEGKDLEAMLFANNYYASLIRLFSPYLGEKVAEVGAGTGNLSTLILKENISELTVVEPSANLFPLLCENLKEAPNAVTINSYFHEISPDYQSHFDSILYVNVLEHIKDDKIELEHIKKSLNSNGCVCIFVPALSWLYSDFDKSIGHYRRYHKEDLIRLVKASGLNVIKAGYIDFFGIFPWYLSLVILKNKLNAKHVNLYDKYIFPATNFIENILPVPIGKNLFLIAQK
jgi:2-polyprenyl-3-methyl-5-hydroxy-6-metoxy-1,4-benzoquinol methylase